MQKHVQYLADDKLQGRRTGSVGEVLAMEYIINQYKQIGLDPKGANGYVQEFEINEGRQIDGITYFKIGDQQLRLNEDYFPLSFCATKAVKGAPAMALTESNQPWFKDLKELLEENKTNPHFDIEEAIKKVANDAAAKKATALLLFNSSTIIDNVQFNKNDRSAAAPIPIIYLTKEAQQKYFSDYTATLQLAFNIAFSDKIRKARNLVGFINNNAANTVVLGAHYDHLGFGEDKNALDTGQQIHNGADDNASGTAALIEVVRLLKKKAPLNNNYLIINFSGEE